MRSRVFGSKVTFQPLGAEPDSSTSSAGAVPVLVTRIATELSTPAVARVDNRPPRPERSSLGWAGAAGPGAEGALGASEETRAGSLYFPAPMGVGGVALSL